jgi:GxxExxY protein
VPWLAQAMLVEFRRRNISYESEKIIPVQYKGHNVGHVRADIVIENNIVIELKAIAKIRNCDRLQALNYAQLLGIKESYVVNFSETEAVICVGAT